MDQRCKCHCVLALVSSKEHDDQWLLNSKQDDQSAFSYHLSLLIFLGASESSYFEATYHPQAMGNCMSLGSDDRGYAVFLR